MTTKQKDYILSLASQIAGSTVMKCASAAILLAALVACGAPSRGVVIEKDYAPAHTTTTCNLVGKVTVCSPQYQSESWSIKIRSGEDEGWRSVDGETWRQIKVGQFVDFGGDES